MWDCIIGNVLSIVSDGRIVSATVHTSLFGENSLFHSNWFKSTNKYSRFAPYDIAELDN